LKFPEVVSIISGSLSTIALLLLTNFQQTMLKVSGNFCERLLVTAAKYGGFASLESVFNIAYYDDYTLQPWASEQKILLDNGFTTIGNALDWLREPGAEQSAHTNPLRPAVSAAVLDTSPAFLNLSPISHGADPTDHNRHHNANAS
jgi:hypothetical protein